MKAEKEKQEAMEICDDKIAQMGDVLSNYKKENEDIVAEKEKELETLKKKLNDTLKKYQVSASIFQFS
mgnify:CR=1 FL=1